MARAAAEVALPELFEAAPSRSSRLKRLGQLAIRKPLGTLGAVILLVVVVFAVFGPGIEIGGTEVIPGFAPYDPNSVNPLNREKSPGGDNILGTDALGRDVFSRIIYGARPSLIIGIVGTGLGILAGTVIGLFTGYVRGKPDLVVQRLMDGVMSIPPLVLLLALISITEPSLMNIILVLIIFIAPSSSRVVRGAVMTVTANPYVEAARTVGAGPLRITLRHILPNVFAPIMVLVSVIIGGTILVEASLSFLGMGVPPPDATWGSMLSSGNQSGTLQRAPWIAIAPGVAITLTVLAFNLLGDALRDILDPRLRGT